MSGHLFTDDAGESVTRVDRRIRVLLVDDEPGFTEIVALHLERENDAFETVREHDADAALDRLQSGEVDCIVSDYEMPNLDGLSFLEAVRETFPRIPFIFYTGRGDESVASEAISAGVDDYLTKGNVAEQATLLARRIETLVRNHRMETELDRRLRAIETAQEGIAILSEDGKFRYVNRGYADIFGYEPGELVGEQLERLYPDRDVSMVHETLLPAARDGGWTGRARQVRADGTEVLTEQALAYTDTADLVCTVRDITDERETEQELFVKDRAMDAAPIGIVLTDPSRPDNPIIYANEGFEELTGYAETDAVGRNCRFLQGDGTEDEATRRLREAIAEERPVTVELRNYRADGTEFWNQVDVAPVYDEHGDLTNFVGFQRDVTERKRYERTLTSLHERTREMMRADDAPTTAHVAVETTDELLAFEASAFYTFDGANDELVSAAPAADVPDPVEMLVDSSSRSLLWEAFVDGESAVYERLSERGVVADGVDLRRLVVVPVGNHGVLVTGGTDAATVTDTQHRLAQLVAKNLEAALDRTDHRRAIAERDRRLRDQNEALTQLNRINEVIRDINQSVVRASTREEIERTVCERFAETGVYEFAWVGEPVDGGLTVRTWAGVDAEYVDSLNERESPLRSLVTAASESREVRVARRLLDDADWNSHRREVLTYGYRSVAAVPIRQDDRLDGVLVIYASDRDAFDERERAVLAELGRTVGYTIDNAVRASGVPTSGRTEVELSVEDQKLFANRLAAATGGTVTLEGTPVRTGDRLTAFVRLTNADVDSVASTVDDCEPVESVGKLGDGAGVYRTTLSVPPLVGILRDADATLRSLSATGGTATVVADLPATGDVRSLVEAVRSQYPGTTMLARRERDATVETQWTFGAELRERLTDRQLEVLRTAYHGGYYQSPRESTGDELADALGITPPTYHHHLRAAEEKIVSAVLESI